MNIRTSVKEICDKKPFTPWFPVFVGIGTAVGAGPDVPMAVGVGAGVVLGLIISLWRMKAV